MDNKRKIGCILGIEASVLSIVLAIVFAVIMNDEVIPSYVEALIKENPAFLMEGAWREVQVTLTALVVVISAIVIVLNLVSIVLTALYFSKGDFKHVAGVVNFLVVSPLNIAAGVLILKCDD